MLLLYLFFGVIFFYNMLFFMIVLMILGNYFVVEVYVIVFWFIYRELWYRCIGFLISVIGYCCMLYVIYKMLFIMVNIRMFYLMYILCILYGI